MTRTHFRQIADALNDIRKFESHDVELSSVPRVVRYSDVVAALAKVCAGNSPRFDYCRFYAACGIGEQKPKGTTAKLRAAEAVAEAL